MDLTFHTSTSPPTIKYHHTLKTQPNRRTRTLKISIPISSSFNDPVPPSHSTRKFEEESKLSS